MALRCVVMIEKVPGAVHHQEADQPAALIDHGDAHFAAELVRLGHGGEHHLHARFVGEPMGGDDFRHDQSPNRDIDRNHMTQNRLPC